ncbi:MAG: hypothetical protein HY579_02115 [Nitrospinae bacterium]|nr:hypothetical protein [Nitrospinota bacterium]
MATKHPLEKEFKYYLEHQNELVKKYNGKFVVIKDCVVIGVFDDEDDAIEQTSQKYELGTFIVQKCTPGPEEYTRTFHSRVVF